MAGMYIGAFVAIGLFMIGVIFNAGRQHARIEQLEKGREEAREDLVAIRQDLNTIRELFVKRYGSS